MGKRGPKPKGKVKIKWSPDFAYAIGLIASDGCLSGDRRHICFVSKDIQQVNNFSKALGLKVKAGKHKSGNGKLAYRVQFGDVLFYQFLLSIGLTPAKSKTLGVLDIPEQYFFHFLRGVFDGDGYSYSYWDKRWKSSFMFYLGFCSASHTFISWLRQGIDEHLGIKGHVNKVSKKLCYQLKYSKYDAIKIVKKMYLSKGSMHLPRKYLKIAMTLGIVKKRASGET